MSLERLTSDSLSRKEVPLVANALLRLPSIFNISLAESSIPSSLRVRLLFSLRCHFTVFVLVCIGTFNIVRSFVDDEFLSIDLLGIGR